MYYVRKIYRSIGHAIRGMRHAYSHELSFRMEVWAGLVFVLVGYITWPISPLELFFMVLSYVLVLGFELMNTALERMFERLHPEHHELVGISKDLASGAVCVMILFSGFVVGFILFTHPW